MQSGWMDGLGKDGVSADSSHIVTKSPLGDDKSFDWSTFNWVVVRLHHSLHFTLANRPLNRLYDGTNFTNLEPVQSNIIIIILIPIRTPPHQLQDNQVVLDGGGPLELYFYLKVHQDYNNNQVNFVGKWLWTISELNISAPLIPTEQGGKLGPWRCASATAELDKRVRLYVGRVCVCVCLWEETLPTLRMWTGMEKYLF